MKLIIDIDEETYENCKAWANVATVFSEETKSIANGIPYEERPQGDLISRSALKRAIEQGEGFSWDSHGKDDLCVRKKYIDNAPTVENTINVYPSGNVVVQERPQASNNAELFKQTFGIYATELWSMKEADFLKWLNAEVTETDEGLQERAISDLYTSIDDTYKKLRGEEDETDS